MQFNVQTSSGLGHGLQAQGLNSASAGHSQQLNHQQISQQMVISTGNILIL